MAEELFGSQQDLFVLVNTKYINSFVPDTANGNDIGSVVTNQFSGNYASIPLNYLTLN